MKTNFYLSIIALLFLLPAAAQTNQVPTTQKSLPDGISGDWYSKATVDIKQREYAFKSLMGNSQFGAANRNNGVGFLINKAGYSVKNIQHQSGQENWSVDFSIAGIGKKKQYQQPAIAPLIYKTEHSLQYAHPGFDIQYINDETGMRQNFIVNEKPAGEGELEVIMQLSGNLVPSLLKANTITFYNPKTNETKLIYDGLKVWDAEHKLLPAHMELDNDRLSIIVDDKDAVYPVTVDPLNHTPDWTDNGQGLLFPLLDDATVHTLYGFSVSGAGNVNGDAYGDIIIGAPGFVDIISISGNSFNFITVGAAFIYYGSATGPSLTPNEALQPTTEAGALFGFSVSKAGDVNGDGFGDIVVGAPGDHTNLTVNLATVSVTTGKAYVYYGGSGGTFDGNVNTEPTVNVILSLNQADFGTLLTTPINPLYGFSVSEAGNVNGDAYGDIIVGSPAYSNVISPILGQGRADLFYGSAAGIATTPSRTITGNVLDALFGFSVSTAGNVNGDAYSDIIVGAPSDLTVTPVAVGGAYVFHGSATGITATTTAGAAISLNGGITNNTLFGYSVSNAGDVNGDTFGDVIVGEPGATESVLGLVAVGKAHIFYGSAGGVALAGSTQLLSPRRASIIGILQGNLLFGYSVSGAGDVNCDGLADVIIGEPGGTAVSLGSGVVGLLTTNALSGRAYVYYGRTAKPLNSPSYVVEFIGPLTVANLLGHSVSDAGDVNGDGKADILIGAPNGTLDLSKPIRPLVVDVIHYITVNSIGSAYAYFGCLNAVDLDNDNDGIPDAIDVDDDNDGIPDRYEFATGKNGGFTPAKDPSADDDGDGVPNYKDVDNSQCGGLNTFGICVNYDRDGDGIPNHFDLDSDNDGLPDVIEAGGHDANGDGRLDCSGSCDADADGLLAPVDINDASQATYATSTNISKEAISPNTYVYGIVFYNGVLDTDSDTVPDFLDIDSDNDGIYDIIETGGTDASGDGRVDYTGSFTTVDADNDGLFDAFDADTNNDGDVTDPGEGTQKSLIISVSATADGIADSWTDGPSPDRFPVDFDSDILPNYRDLESDSDGINDVLEAGGPDPDGNGIIGIGPSNGLGAGGILVVNGDGYASATLAAPLISTDADSDGDGRPNDDSDPELSPYFNGGGATPYGGSSTSPTNFRPDQDGDTRPNFLDLDSDNDGINDIIENIGVPVTTTIDTNNDGLIDVALRVDVDFDGIADGGGIDGAVGTYGDAGNVPPINTDLVDPNSAQPDSDNVPDYLDLDSDNDGLFDVREGGNASLDANGDGIVDCTPGSYAACDPDLDGILASVDGQLAVIGDAASPAPPDTDGDGLPDYRDLDSNNDGIFDAVGAPGVDADNDGRKDGTDTDYDGIINILASDSNAVFGGNIVLGTPLPVTLVDFKARQNQQTVEVSWTTEQEINLRHFEVLRSTDGINYITIGTVNPTGGVFRTDYVFIDRSPVKGNNYYRLKSVDIDSKLKYSAIVLVKLVDKDNTLITIFPNPVQNDYRIRMVGLERGIYRIELVNSLGQLQFTKKITVTQYDHVETVNRGKQPSGVYWLTIYDEQNNKIKRLGVVMNLE